MNPLVPGGLLCFFMLPALAGPPLNTLDDWMAGTGPDATRVVRDQFRLYAFGVVLGADILTTEMGRDLPAWAHGVCVPNGTSSSRAMDLLRAEAQRQPNLGDSNSAVGLRQLASNVFPCGR